MAQGPTENMWHGAQEFSEAATVMGFCVFVIRPLRGVAEVRCKVTGWQMLLVFCSLWAAGKKCDTSGYSCSESAFVTQSFVPNRRHRPDVAEEFAASLCQCIFATVWPHSKRGFDYLPVRRTANSLVLLWPRAGDPGARHASCAIEQGFVDCLT